MIAHVPHILTDAELWQLIRQNDIAAFTELYNRYWKKMYQSANNVLHNTETAGDIVQDIFTSLWERRHELIIEFPCTYLMHAVRFRVLKAIRLNKANDNLDERLQNASLSIISENIVLFKEMEDLLDAILKGLPESQRKIFMMNRTEGLTYREIANELNISLKTVEKKISGALKQIRFVLNKTLFF